MLTFLADTLARWQTQARYRRRVSEQLLQLVERKTSLKDDDAAGWQQISGATPQSSLSVGHASAWRASRKLHLRDQARQLVSENPHARNLLRLMEIYVVGAGLELTFQAHRPEDQELANAASRLWKEFLSRNSRHFSPREYARRAWRDGEVFLRLFPMPDGSLEVRFIDPEAIAPLPHTPEDEGIVTLPGDVESVVAYHHVDPLTGQWQGDLPAEEVIHTRIGIDSNERRGISLFAPILDSLSRFDHWLETELTARKLQASLVLWRKIQGSPAQLSQMAESGHTPRERYLPGSILTTSHTTDLQFLSPNTNFGDAVPLGRLLLLCVAAGAGLPEFMLSSDASNASYSSTMVAEGPAVKLFESEQQFFAREFEHLSRAVLRAAAMSRGWPEDLLDRIVPHWSFPQLVNRDRPRERLADVQLVEQGILSRAEVARRDHADPQTMRRELNEEAVPIA